jgi:hypothetical protein
MSRIISTKFGMMVDGLLGSFQIREIFTKILSTCWQDLLVTGREKGTMHEESLCILVGITPFESYFKMAKFCRVKITFTHTLPLIIWTSINFNHIIQFNTILLLSCCLIAFYVLLS